MDKAKFYKVLRDSDLVNLTEQNVFGFEKHLDYAMAHNVPLQKLKYILPTSYWETGATMQPVVEANWLSEEWRRKNLRYYPWHGRGLAQTTWKHNYEKIDAMLALGGWLLRNPDALLKWEYALPALFNAMEQGTYTGRDLNDYIDDLDESDAEDHREMVNARRIINGTDKAKQIASLGIVFERALKAAKYGSK